MRMVIVVVLALIAVAAGGVWALGQFGGGAASVTSEARAPLVREPEIVVAAAPAQAPSANTTPALRSAPAAPKAVEPAKPVETTTPSAEAAAPAADPAAPQAEPKANLKTGLDETGGLKIPLPEMQKRQAPAQPETPATPPQAEARVQAQSAPVDAPEQRVTTQQAAASAAAVPTGLEAQFKSRRLTYNRPPEKLALDKAIDISLIIDTSRQTDAAERLQGLPGTVVERDVDLSDTVSAELLGAAFDIQLQTTSTRQKLSSKLANEWRWRVTPRQKGTHTLTLNVYGFAVGSADAEPLDSYRDDITVEVQPVDELVTWAKGVQPLFAVLAALAGVGSATFAFLRFREERKQTTFMSSKSDQ
ncbi:MAG: hypothetical protein QM773_18945 [Hyphomonadaceae bacterium]